MHERSYSVDLTEMDEYTRQGEPDKRCRLDRDESGFVRRAAWWEFLVRVGVISLMSFSETHFSLS